MPSTSEAIKAIIAPLLVIVLGMVVLLLDVGKPTAQRKRLLPLVSIVGLILAGVAAAANLGVQTVGPDTEPGVLVFGRGMISDSFGALFCIVLCIIAAFSIGMAGRYLSENDFNQGEFYALILFSTSGAMLMALSFDLVNVFIGLEVLSVSLYILSGYARRELRSEEAAVKYFLLGAFASGFLLYGTALIYGAVGSSIAQGGHEVTGRSWTNFYTIGEVLRASAASGAPLAASPLFVAGVAFVIVGLGFKASIVPFHAYAPDVYEGAPTPVTAFMSAGAKAGAFAAFIRFYQVLLNGNAVVPFEAMLAILATLTMIVGNVLAVRQTNLKRMLAYSSIAHAGYILVGVLASGVERGRVLSQGAVLYYLFAYTFMNLGAFAVLLWLGRNRDGREYMEISDLAGLSRSQPLAAAALSLFMLSLAGVPPAAGFFGKLYLFLGAVQAGYAWLALLGLVVSVIGVYYYFNIVVAMYFRPASDLVETSFPRAGGAKTVALIAAIATLLLGVIDTRLFTPQIGNVTGSLTKPATAAEPPSVDPQ